MNNLAVRLGEVGRRADGLTAAQEAVQLYQKLAEAEPDMYGAAADRAADVVTSLHR